MRFLILTLGFLSIVRLLAGEDLSAGSAVVDITPKKWPVALRGSFVPKLAEAAHDPLTARAIVLAQEETKVAIVVVDSCMVHRPELDSAKAVASRLTGISVANMLVSATHTHSAPFANATHNTPEELDYQRLLIDGIAQSIVIANAALEPAEVGYANDHFPDEVFNRRWFMKAGTVPTNPFGEDTDLVKMNPPRGKNLINPAAPTDPEFSVLSVRDRKGRPLGLLANYSLHYVGNTAGQISADYFGEFNRLMNVRLRQRQGSKFVSMLSNGTSGDINNVNFRTRIPPREPYEQIRIVASKAADSAYRAYHATEHRRDLSLGMRERIVKLKMRVPSKSEVTRSKDFLQRAEDESNKIPVPLLSKIYAQRILKLAEMPPETSVVIQVIRVGDLAICALPFEVLVEIGLELKEKSPFADTFVIELANGGFGYLPTREQHALGGYETWLATNKVEIDSAEILIKNLVEMMAELK